MLFNNLKNEDKNSREVMMLPTIAQFRTIRHIVGEYVFTGEVSDVKFDNAIGSCGDFRSKGKHYQIPYTSLYNKDYLNILTAGRIISASGDGWEITRVIPVCALTGQAAGVAAALSIHTNNVSSIDINVLQQKLKKSGVLFI